jgi:hypothetical protein
MRVLAPWTQIQNRIASETLGLFLPNYDIASETIRIESLVQKAGANKEIFLA